MMPAHAVALLVGFGMWSGLARAAIGSPIFAALLDGVALVLLAFAAWSARRRGRWGRLTTVDLLVVTFVAIAAIEIFNPNVPSPLVGLEGFRKTAFMAVGYGIARLSPRSSGGRFMRVVLILSIPALLWSIRQFFVPLPLELAIISTSGASTTSFHSGTVLRAFAPTASPFHLGVLAGSVAIGASILADRRSIRWLLIAIAAAVALGLSLTRANLLATVLALTALAMIVLVRERRRRPLVFAAVVAAVALVVAAYAASSQPPYAPPGSVRPASPPATVGPDRSPAATSSATPTRAPSTAGSDASPGATPSVAATPPPIRVPNLLEDRSLLFRFEFWREQLSAIAQRPLIGFGTSSAADGFDRLYAGTSGRNFEPHSIYTKVLLEQGLIGFLVFLTLLARLLLIALRGVVRRVDQPFRWWALGILLLVGVSGLTGPMLDAYPFNLLFWTVAGSLGRPQGSTSRSTARHR